MALFLAAASLFITNSQAATSDPVLSTVDADGTVHIPAISVPLSSLESEAAKQNFRDFVHGFASLSEGPSEGDGIEATRKRLDDRLFRPGVEKLRAVFPVTIKAETIGGVQTDVIDPTNGIAARNKDRVLINLHGGGFAVGARLGGQMESIPIASLGKIRVITVDYREGPEHKFPAASEDVAAVYRTLLKRYRPKNIGIYGCSAGGMLTAETVAWLQTHDLPKPGAIGIFGSGAIAGMRGDSDYVGALLMGWSIESEGEKPSGYFDVPDLNLKDPLVSPGYSSSLLATFPPTLILSGTRDIGLSPAVYTHAQMIRVGVAAELFVFEGAAHCSFAQPVVDPNVPETRQVWDVTVAFFDKHLGH